MARHLLTTDDPVQAEFLASMIVATWQRKGMQHDLDAEWATHMLDALGATARAESLAMLLGLGAVAPGPHAARAKRAVQLLVAQHVPKPGWAAQVGRAVVTESWIMHEVLGDGVDIILGCRYPDGHEHSVLVYIDTNMGMLVKDAFPGPSLGETLASLRAQIATAPAEDAALEAVAVSDFEEREEIAHQLVWHGCYYDGSGDPLRWSPVVAEIVMCDWWPRKVMGDRHLHVQVPAVAKAWVCFAGRKKGLRDGLIDETVAAIDECGAEFLDLVGDPGSWGPAKSVAQQMLAAGIDFSDQEAVQAFVGELNRRADPFAVAAPHAEFEWKGIATTVEWRVRQMLTEIDRICARALDERYRLDAYAAVRRLALARPSPLCKGWPYVWAGGVLYYLAQNRGLFRHSDDVYLSARDLAALADASSNTLGAKARQIRELLGDEEA
jgi:hypothetical protein